MLRARWSHRDRISNLVCITSAGDTYSADLLLSPFLLPPLVKNFIYIHLFYLQTSEEALLFFELPKNS
jgi:hypothetical protein